MTRDAFLEGFTERLRHVLQTHSREVISSAPQIDYGEFMGVSIPNPSTVAANAGNTDAAIDELARYLCDAFDRPAE